MSKPKILVLCTGNSCRSQMAEGYLKYFAGDNAEIYSAGVETHGVNPLAVASMLEDDIDISGQTSNHVDEYRHMEFDYIITVCDHAREVCPYIPGAGKRLHQNFPDPSKISGSPEEIRAGFSAARNQIKAYCRQFVEQNFI